MTVSDGRPVYIGLLRGINVGGANRLPMAELRVACEELGWREVRTYIQSGNVVFAADGPPDRLEDELERVIAERFDLAIPVIVRTRMAWDGYRTTNPFVAASDLEARSVALSLSKSPPKIGAAGELRERATAGERVEIVGDGVWIHYPNGMGRSKLTPALLDRLVGSPITARNWRTVVQLAEMASATPDLESGA